MSGYTFLYSAALWGLPLAALPVIVHLLFQKKSPVVLFSTVRFIRASVQRTAARKRVQKWILLATRIVLLALLIAAVAQPARLLGSGWGAGGKSTIAAVVVDTSYSMMLTEHQQPLLARADAAVRELLGTQLANARVAIFRSPPPPPGQPEQLRDAAEILGQWTQLAPQANPRPLVDRIASAVDLLNGQHADDKWLVVISDFQKREFPSSLPAAKDMRIVMIDLHGEEPRSAGITRVAVEPQQPTPGIGSEAIVEITGRPSTARPVSVSASAALGGKELLHSGVQMANLDASGHARLRIPLRLPAERWMALKASLADEDDMTWDDARVELIETPPKQLVTFLGNPRAGPTQRAVWLALDPTEGANPQGWSLAVKQGDDISPDSAVAALLADDWPDDARTARLLGFVRGGGTLILFLRPGLEETWARLPENRRAALAQLLPSEPLAIPTAPLSNVSVAAASDPLVAGFADERFQIHNIVVRRMVPFSADPKGTLLLTCFPSEPRPGLHAEGLLYRRAVGTGLAYVFSTLPDRQFTNLNLHPLFLPLLVRMAQRPPSRSDVQNIEMGEPLALSGRQYYGYDNLVLQAPQGETTVVKSETAGGVTRFAFGLAAAPGLYQWLGPGSNDPVALTNVQLPAAESELVYLRPDKLVESSDNVMIARSVAELQAKVANLGQPEPQWSLPIAIVLLLLCVEALMSSLSRMWNARSPAPTPA